MTANLDLQVKHLTLWFTQLKQESARLSTVAASLRAVGGVHYVAATPSTGGLAVHYDAAHGATAAFWNDVEAALLSHQLFHDPRPLGRTKSSLDPPIRRIAPRNLLECNAIFT